ncbi:MAG: site-specific DNA-methyltransferase [Cardiobacteriaceae bacterium]|nr:site-specific DNA-methyltransferase [Cardiobacteriaceae bacterium]
MPDARAELDWQRCCRQASQGCALSSAGTGSRIVLHRGRNAGSVSQSVNYNPGNLIVQGDNLDALKALLPRYAGQVKCIYIDPPYNTGNEGWIYNDNVNSPEIRRWLGEVVGKEGETLDRHDRWLCMMYPRLVLLRQFLREDGVIFVSIDDNEVANLRLLMDEIFGIGNFVAHIPWRKRTAKSDVPFGISQDFEAILCYSKSAQFTASVQGKERKYYESADFPDRPWRIHDLTKQTTAEERPNSFFTIVNPKTGEEYPASPIRTWAVSKETFQEYYDAGKIIFPGDYDFLKITRPAMRYFKDDDERKAEKAGKLFGHTAVSTLLPEKIVGMTQDGTKEITEIFGSKIFSFPKPCGLIQFLTKISTNKDSLILDSFAGSGTTAHAVLKQNAEDGGQRRFILVEMDRHIAENVTAERVRRVADGYTNGKGQTVAGLGGGFQFCRLSAEPLFRADGQIREDVTFAQLAEFVWFAETGTGFGGKADSPLLGIHEGRAIYLLFNGILKDKTPQGGNVLTAAVYGCLPPHSGAKVIYAAANRMGSRTAREGITFKQTPYALEV